MKHILFVENRESLPGLKLCKKLGYKISFLTQDLQFYLKNEPIEKSDLRFVDDIIHGETNNENSVVDFVKRYHAKHHLDAVLSFSELYVIQATAAAQSIGLISMDSDATKNSRNKYITRKLCQENGIPTPKFFKFKTIEEAFDGAEKIGYPCIIKPCHGASSVGVKYVNSRIELKQAYDSYMKNRNYGRGLYGESTLLLEEYLEGDLYSVETITINGNTHVLGITDRILTDFPYFVEVGFTYPVHNSFKDDSIKLVKNCLSILGINFGVCHTEIVLTKEGPMLIEVNPRMGGGPIHELVSYASGIDLAEETIKIHLGEPPSLIASNDQTAAAKYFFADKDGILVSAEGINEVTDRDDVKQINVEKIGENVRIPKSNFDLLGKVIIVGDNRHLINKKMKEIEQTIQLNIAP